MKLFKIAVVLGLSVSAALAQVYVPGGRLTLTSNTPVMTSDSSGATSVYYAPYVGYQIPIYGGSSFANNTFSQLTMTLNTSNQVSGDVYDLFVFLDSGVVTVGAGPAWSSTTSRGTGAGTTQLTQLDGLWVNANSITLTNGSTSYSSIPADEATYVGSVYMTADGETTVNIKPSPASGGTNNIVGIWNAYNRVPLMTLERDSTSSYTYGTIAWREMDGSASNRISWLDGLGQTSVRASVKTFTGTASAESEVDIGVDLNSTTAGPNIYAITTSATSNLSENLQAILAEESFPPQLGFNYVQAMENAASGVTSTFYAGKLQTLLLDLDY